MKFNPIKESTDGKRALQMVWSSEIVHAAIKGLEQGKKLVANPFYENKTKLLKGDLVFERTPEEIEEWKRCKNDIIYFANNYCKLMTPTGIRNVEMRDYQRDYLEHLMKNRLSIFLSCRQSGKTTTSAIFLLHYILFNTDKNSLVLGNKRKTAVEILDKLKKIFLELPYFLKPGVYKWNEGQIVLDNGCMCMAEATTTNSGISFTFHCVLADEFAHIQPNILDSFYNNLFPVVTAGKARFMISSTQNGYNLFYKLWCSAAEGENEYAPFKVDWWQVPEWNPDTQRFEKRDEEWHKLQIANYGGEENFNKQFGTNFSIAGNSLIPPKLLNKLEARSVEFEPADIPGLAGSQYFFWDPTSTVTPYNIRNEKTVITVDISEADGGDYIVAPINILKMRENGEAQLVTVGYFYCNENGYKWCAETLRNFCMICLPNPNNYLISVELNLYGELFVNYMMNMIDNDARTVSIFNEESFVRYYNDSMTKCESGARITRNTKAKYCKLFKRDIEDNTIDCRAAKFNRELANFCDVKGNGTYKASFGHDDFVMSMLQLEAVFETRQWKFMKEDFEEANSVSDKTRASVPGYYSINSGNLFDDGPISYQDAMNELFDIVSANIR